MAKLYRREERRREGGAVTITSSLALSAFSLCYAIIPSYRIILALVIVHGIFWSGLLSAFWDRLEEPL